MSEASKREALTDKVPNPFLRYPPSERCLCNSKHKWRRCCGPKIARTVSVEDAEKVDKYLKIRFGI